MRPPRPQVRNLVCEPSASPLVADQEVHFQIKEGSTKKWCSEPLTPDAAAKQPARGSEHLLRSHDRGSKSLADSLQLSIPDTGPPNVSGGLPNLGPGGGVLQVPLTWDGIEESVPLPPIPFFGPVNMFFNEQNLAFPGNPAFAATPGTGYEHAGGEYLET